MSFSELAGTMLVFVVLIFVGWAFAKKGMAGPEFKTTASKLVANIFITAFILKSALSIDLSPNVGNLGNIMLVLTTTCVICVALSAAITAIPGLKVQNKAVFELVSAYPNMFISIPILEQLAGPLAAFYCSLACIPFNIFLFSHGVMRLSKNSGQGKFNLKNVLSMPVIAALLSLLIFIIKPTVPFGITKLINTAAGACVPVSMIVIGATLGSVSVADSFKKPEFYISSFIRLVAAPLIVWFFASLLTDNNLLICSSVIVAASPCALLVPPMSIQYGHDGSYASQGLLQSTVFSMLTIPVFVYFLT